MAAKSIARNSAIVLVESLDGIGGGKGQPTTAMVDLPPFTCIGATTLSGLVSDPLRSRFVQVLQLEPGKTPADPAQLQTGQSALFIVLP